MDKPSIIELGNHLKYLAETSCFATFIAIIDSDEKEENQQRLSRWTKGIKTPTDTAPREDIQIERLSEYRTAVAVPEDLPVLLNVLRQSRTPKPTAWVLIQKSKIPFPEKIRRNNNIPHGGATVKTGSLDDTTYYVAAQAADPSLALEAIRDAVADPHGTIEGLRKLGVNQAQASNNR